MGFDMKKAASAATSSLGPVASGIGAVLGGPSNSSMLDALGGEKKSDDGGWNMGPIVQGFGNGAGNGGKGNPGGAGGKGTGSKGGRAMAPSMPSTMMA